jgi:methenyltetrahydromethanopterin cyclohydrolase
VGEKVKYFEGSFRWKDDSMISVNEGAAKIVEEMIERKEELGIEVSKLENGTTVIDAGIKSRGGATAGIYYAKACMGAPSEISLSMDRRLMVHVFVDNPMIACMASQFAGWAVKVGDYFAMGSGPARALARVEEKLYESLGYRDEFDKAVIALETRKIPEKMVADFIAVKCGVDPKNLYILLAPTASVVGSVQISARVVETGIHKLHELGFDLRRVISGSGSAPVAPVAKNDLEAMGKTNDCVLYGGRTQYFVSAEDSELEGLIGEVPSCASKDYGSTFLELFEKYDRDFYKMDPKLFSPAEVTINNVRTGSIFHAGSLNEEVLKKSLGV